MHSISTLPAAAGDTQPVRRWLRLPRRREKVVRRGVLASVLSPLAMALAAMLVLAGAASIGTNWWTGFSRDRLFSAARQEDGSLAAVRTGEPLRETVTVLMREGDGEVRRLVVERDAADRFVNETLRRLDADRARTKALAHEEVESIFALAFADRDAAIEDYADWFFEWKRSYVVLKEAFTSSLARMMELGDYEPLAVAVERDLKTYFMRHYTEQVLKPERRDPLIAAAFEQAAQRAHERWKRSVAEQDLRLQVFLAEHTDHLAPAGAAGPLTDVALDWDAQRFNAPTWLMEDKAFDGIVSLSTVGAGGTLGALVLRPAINRSMSRVFAGLGRRYAAALAGRIAMTQGGAVAGTAIQPVGGTLVGAFAGGLLGLAADYLMNEASEAMNREGFVAANREAVDATVTVWQGKLEDSLDRAIDRWYDDSRAALVSVSAGD